MRTVKLCMVVLLLAAGLGEVAADPPPPVAKPAPTPAPAAGSASGTVPTPAPSTPSPGTASQPANVPDRIEPTEKVHADSEISFPVDI
jgi:hypothetical protein